MFTYDAFRARSPVHASPTARPARHADRRRVRTFLALLAARHDDFLRREAAAQHETLAHHREVGGDFSVL